MTDTLDIATLVVSFIVSLLTTFITVPWLISRLAKRDIMGIDQNKLDKPRVPEMGGLTVLIGFVAGVSTFLVINKILKDIEYEFVINVDEFQQQPEVYNRLGYLELPAWVRKVQPWLM